MANKSNSEKCELSPEAAKVRSSHYKKWRSDNPEKAKAIRLRYWEKKAQEYYGEDYIGPGEGDELSRQAREVQRKYYAEYRKKNPDIISKANKNYWERKVETV